MNNKLLFKNRWIQIIIGTLLMTIGILVAVFAILDISQFASVISIIVAVFFFMSGAIYLVECLFMDNKKFLPPSLFLCSIAFALGAVLCMNQGILTSVFLYLIEALLLSIGAVCLVRGIIYIILRDKKSKIVGLFIISVVTITLGVVAIVFNKEGATAKAIYATIGILLSIIGIVDIAAGITALVKDRKKVVATQQIEKK